MRHSTFLVALVALTACARSDTVGGAAGGSGEGGWGAGGWYDDGIADEAGPETGAGAGFTTSGGEDGDPVQGGGGAGGSSTLPGCGDGTCQEDVETCSTCEEDCGACAATCGDGLCVGADGEDCDSCEEDCGACAICGDGVCSEPVEDCELCYEDCGVCACEPDGREPNGSSGTSTPATVGVPIQDLSICAGDVDWFRFPVNGTRTITVSFAIGQGDLDLEIFSAATTSYVTGSYSHVADDAQVVLSGVPSGTYWARVYGYQGATNPSYTFLVD